VLLQLNAIERTYRLPGAPPVPVLRGVDLVVEAGAYVALMGPSGSGKTTLLQIIGLLDRPDGGSYRLVGEEIAHLDDDRLAQLRGRTIGFVFQAFQLIANLDVVDNAALPLLYQDVPRRERRRRAAAALEQVGLGHRLGHRPGQLSGGEQQRCAIARALVTQPRLLVADEPTGNLDSATGTSILELFAELHRSGLTIVMVTHDPEVGARAGQIVHMRDGRINP